MKKGRKAIERYKFFHNEKDPDEVNNVCKELERHIESHVNHKQYMSKEGMKSAEYSVKKKHPLADEPVYKIAPVLFACCKRCSKRDKKEAHF